MDRSLGTLFDQLRKRDDWSRTIVAVVGDHGEQFGEHRLAGHGNSVYRQVLHVPLIVRVPGRAAERIDDPVSISDLYATLLQLAGISPGTPRLFDPPSRRPAMSLFLPSLSASGRFAKAVFSIAGPRHHLMRWEDNREELYDYRADPAETEPLPPGGAADLRAILQRNARLPRHRDLNFYSLGYLQ